jgi:methionyl-tRNA synthetase
MAERIFIGVGWPYANGSLHLGHVAGAYLPADIFARYHRLKGNEVLMVSGADQHGTPITLKAEQESRDPRDIIDFYQREFLDCWQKLGITFDLFTGTHTDNHAATAQDIFRKLLDKGYLYRDTVSQLYCPQCRRFLPDRYVEGVCPACKAPGARGDQCDACGKPMNPTELIDPYCRICKTKPAAKDSEHFFLKLSAFQERLQSWVEENKSRWRPNVYGLTLRYLKEGLKDRAITRDIEWGIPVPVEGFENKRLYVWFEAVIGYLSASKQWAKEIAKDNEKWHDFWDENKGAKSYYFIGKDNIPFHTIIWPAMLIGYERLNLPFDVPANEFLTFDNQKGSKSKNWAVWLPDYLSRYDPDPLRYMLSINMPETNDTDFSWREFVRRNNDELVATYGNLVNRVLTFTYRNFDGKVPEPAELGDDDREIQAKARNTIAEMDGYLAECKFKLAILRAMELAQTANRYLDAKAPWKIIKTDRQAAATSLYVALSVITQLKTALYPFMPFSSQKVHEYLGFKSDIEHGGWRWQDLPAGQSLCQPQPLFKKLDDSIIEEETKRLGT